MRIAIVGAGIAGLTVAWRLRDRHDIQVFEAEDHIGGHTHTHDVPEAGRTQRIDTGFIVYNDRTYPNFLALLRELGVANRPTEMSFSVHNLASGLEYAGTNLDTVFAQRRNLLSPRFIGMLRDILRFNGEAPKLLAGPEPGPSLGDYLAELGVGTAFVEDYLAPMGAAIWSSPTGRMGDFPARCFAQFFHNHGLLSLTNRPQWYVLEGGSRAYVDAMLTKLGDRVHGSAPVRSVRREARGVSVQVDGAGALHFDAAVVATHSDQALALIDSPTARERDVLGAIPYQDNEVVLHTDASLMPRNRRAWTSWNYRIGAAGARATASALPTVTYDMNKLQSLAAREHYFVSLNQTDSIDPARIVKRLRYAHPVYTAATLAAQARKAEINGVDRLWFAGAYWRYGFHEDGVVSALDVVAGLERE